MRPSRPTARSTPHATLLVDTYDTLGSGVPNAIRVFNEVLKPLGITKCGIRLDSGDMAYLTRKARKMLDKAGWQSCTITCSNSLDEHLISELIRQGAYIDCFGVGERLITARSESVFGGVYKLVAVEDEDGTVIPKIKISENVGKITNPGFKRVYRVFDREGKCYADYIALADEVVDGSEPLELFDPVDTWKRRTETDYVLRELQIPIFVKGELVYERPTLQQIRAHADAELETLWDEVKRFDNPHNYYVDLSPKLWNLKQELLQRRGK